jgi:hypothetical protein
MLLRRKDMHARVGLLFTWVKQGEVNVKEFRALLEEGTIRAEATVKKDAS